MSHDPLILATAIEAALTAGSMQLAGLGRVTQIDKKGVIDLVTNVDVAIDRALHELIARRFPDHAILTEEMAASPDGAATSESPAREYCWVCDPIDGTTNYAHGLPIFCVSVAVEHDGRPAIGVVFDPSRQELFTAERGEGAYLNGVRLAVSGAASLIDALLCTGFPYDVHQTAGEIVGLFGAFVGRARGVRRLGSAAIDLCYVAAGRLDGFWEQRLAAWDVAAGGLIVEEAGGTVTSFDGSPFAPRGGKVVASNGLIHGDMLATIAGFYRDREADRPPTA